jgi:hypothetical protein
VRKNVEDTVQIVVRIPVSMKAQIDLILLDPVMGKMKYGSFTKLMIVLLRQFIDAQVRNHAQGKPVEQPTLPPI